MDKTPEFWGLPDCEILSCYDEDEVIESVLDDLDEDVPFPEKLIIVGYARMEVKTDKLDPLEHVLEYLDEEYGDPDGEPSTPTEAMRRAEQDFLGIVRREYTPWGCEEVCRKEIVVADWIAANRPDWRNPPPAREDEEVSP